MWKDEWWNGIARHLHHPESPCRSQSGIVALLQEANFDGEICTGSCKAGIVLKLMSSPALWYQEEQEDIACAQVMDDQMNED